MIYALVEVVVAERVDVESHHPHGPNRGLLVEESRQGRRSAVCVAGGEGDRVGVGRPVGIEVRREFGGSAEQSFTKDEQRKELRMPVGHGEELEIDRLAPEERDAHRPGEGDVRAELAGRDARRDALGLRPVDGLGVVLPVRHIAEAGVGVAARRAVGPPQQGDAVLAVEHEVGRERRGRRAGRDVGPFGPLDGLLVPDAGRHVGETADGLLSEISGC